MGHAPVVKELLEAGAEVDTPREVITVIDNKVQLVLS